MSGHHDRRRARPAAMQGALPCVEALAVAQMRLWFSGPEGQARVWNEIAGTLGGRQGHLQMRTFEALLAALTREARRRLTRHEPGCACLTADEATFATLIGAAAEGARGRVVSVALLMVRPKAAERVADLALAVGSGLIAMLAQRPGLVAGTASARPGSPRAIGPQTMPAGPRYLH